MEKQFKIHRFDPESDRQPRYQTYTVATHSSERILDCLNRIKWEQDGTLAYRMSCGHGVCGSDAMRINGRCALACQKLVREYEDCDEILLGPLPSFQVIKDLVVDLTGFMERIKLVRPYLVTTISENEKEHRQSAAERDRFKEAIRCILCASCGAACPVTVEREGYLGPAALVRAFRFIFDSRDEDSDGRLETVNHEDGAWGCVNHFECTKVCPKEIPVTKCINVIKREIKKTRT